jgi:hypothetical protein
MKTYSLTVIALLFAAISFCAPAPTCQQSDAGKCYAVHGRYNIYADGDAIWIIETKRRLEAVDDNLDQELEKAGWQNHSIFGDFLVCPQTPYHRGQKQVVCIQSYKNIRLGSWK